MVAVAAAAIIAVLVIGAALLVATRPPVQCPTQSGGDDGAVAQLRYVYVSDRQMTFTFGPSGASGRFGIPRFDVAFPALPAPARELDTGTRRLDVAFRGASGFNPDLSPSYLGSTLLVPMDPGPVQEAAVTNDSASLLSWRVMLKGAPCPAVSTNVYTWGKSPRAQVTMTFGQNAWITAEHGATYVGAPILAPVEISGRGFRPGSSLALRLAGQDLDSATADGDGRIETGIFVPKMLPGFYELLVTDDAGHRAGFRLMVTDEL